MSSRISKFSGIHAWIVCITGSLLLFYDFINMTFFSSIGGYFVSKYGLTGTMLGTLSALLFYGNVIMQIPGGYVSDRFSIKRVLMIASFIGATSVLLLAFADSLWQLELMRFIMGLVTGYGFVTALKLTSNWFPREKLGKAMGTMITFGMLGGIVAEAPMALLYSYIGGKNTIICTSALGFVIFALIALIVKDGPEIPLTATTENQEASPKLHAVSAVICILKSRQNWFAALYITLINLPIMIFGYIWGSIYLKAVYSLSNVTACSIASMIFFGTICGNPVIGAISDKMASRKKPIIVCGILAIVNILAIIMLHSPHVVILFILFFTLGFITSSLSLGYPIIAESNSSLVTGIGIALAGTLVQLASVLQPIFGEIVDYLSKAEGFKHGFSPHAFKIAALMLPISFAIATLLAVYIKESYNGSRNT